MKTIFIGVLNNVITWAIMQLTEIPHNKAIYWVCYNLILIWVVVYQVVYTHLEKLEQQEKDKNINQ